MIICYFNKFSLGIVVCPPLLPPIVTNSLSLPACVPCRVSISWHNADLFVGPHGRWSACEERGQSQCELEISEVSFRGLTCSWVRAFMCMHVVHVYGRNACVYRCVPIFVLIHMIQLSKISDLRILELRIMYTFFLIRTPIFW